MKTLVTGLRPYDAMFDGEHAFVPCGSDPACMAAYLGIVKIVWDGRRQWVQMPRWAEWIYACLGGSNAQRRRLIAYVLHHDLGPALNAAIVAQGGRDVLLELLKEGIHDRS